MMMMTLYTKEGFWDAGAVDGFPWLFVGSLSAAETQSRLQEANVTRLLTVARDLPVSSKTYATIQKTLQVDLDDHPHANLLQVAEACCEFIDQAELDATTTTTTTTTANAFGDDDDDAAPLIPSILVHCASGASRSVSIIMAWLMTRKDYTLDQALSAIRQNRSLANPNDGFLQQLKFLEHHEMTTTTTTTTQNNDDDDQSLLSTMATTRIAAANRRYEDSMRGEKEERTQLQIRLANDVHRDVDDLEVKIQRFRSVMTRMENNDDYNNNNNNPQSFLLTNNNNNHHHHHNTTITITSLLREATFLSDRLDSIASNSTGGNKNNNNNNSKVILKAARNKLERLIKTLEMTTMTTTNTTHCC